MNVLELLKDFRDKILASTDKVLELIPPEKRQLSIIGFGIIMLLIIFVIFIAMFGRGGSGREQAREDVFFTTPLIPHDELFYPAEPDFVPRLLLEREPRGIWTAEDTIPFWQDPRQGLQEQWVEEASLIIDRFMEGIN